MGRLHVVDSANAAVAGKAAKSGVVAGQEPIFTIIDEDFLPCLQRRQRATSALTFGKALCVLGFFGERFQVFL